MWFLIFSLLYLVCGVLAPLLRARSISCIALGLIGMLSRKGLGSVNALFQLLHCHSFGFVEVTEAPFTPEEQVVGNDLCQLPDLDYRHQQCALVRPSWCYSQLKQMANSPLPLAARQVNLIRFGCLFESGSYTFFPTLPFSAVTHTLWSSSGSPPGYFQKRLYPTLTGNQDLRGWMGSLYVHPRWSCSMDPRLEHRGVCLIRRVTKEHGVCYL